MKPALFLILITLSLLLIGCSEIPLTKKIMHEDKIIIFPEDGSGTLFPDDTTYTGDLLEEEIARPSDMIEK